MRPQDVDVRLDAFLHHHLPWRSRAAIQRLVKAGHILVEPAAPERPGGSGELAQERRPGRRLLHGARVVVVVPAEQRLEIDARAGDELAILWDDERALAVDKPPMVAVHPAGRHLTDTLIQRIHARFRPPRGSFKLCHRLDRETSGLVLVAKDPESHRKLMRQFELREVEKEYLAIVHGEPEEDAGEVTLPIGPARRSEVRLKMAVLPDGLPSRTSWRVVERRGSCALVACRLHTGRQHQIRVHMEALGHPLLGDKLYGVGEDVFLRSARGTLPPDELARLGLPRHALHNHRLVFAHPSTKERVEVVSPLAADMQAWLDRAR